MLNGISRLRYIVVDQWRLVALLGILLVGSGSGITLFAGVPMQEETRLSSGGTITVEQQHSARVTQNASVYPRGEVLRGKSLYLISGAPIVTVREVVRTDGGQPVTVNLETRVVYQVEYADSVVYRKQGVTASEHGEITDGNESVGLEVNMTQVQNRLRGLRDRFGKEVNTQALIVTRVEYDSGSSDSIVTRTPIQFTSRGYHVPATAEKQQYGTVKTVHEPAPERTVSVGNTTMGEGQLLGVGLVLAGITVIGISLGYLRRVTEATKLELYREVLHQRYSDLIAIVNSGECPSVDREMESLQDLIFVGEDGGKPVLYFPDDDRYIVECDGNVYSHQLGSTATIPEESLD